MFWIRVNNNAVRTQIEDKQEAFYAALEVNDSAVKILSDETQKAIACELF